MAQVDGAEEELLTGQEVAGAHPEHEDDIEVDPAQVRPDPPGASDPVDVGDVGVHRRPDQEEPAADAARFRPAVAAGRGVSELVEDHRGDGQREDGQQQDRLVEDLQHRGHRPVEAEQPDVHGDHGAQHQDDHQRPVQPGERATDAVDLSLVEHHLVALEGEQQVGARGLDGLVADLVVGDGDAERGELLLDQVGDVLLTDLASEEAADAVGDRLGVAPAVDGARDQVEQPGELHHLAVPPPGDVLGLGEPRALVLAVQLQARAQPGHREDRGRRRIGRGRVLRALEVRRGLFGTRSLRADQALGPVRVVLGELGVLLVGGGEAPRPGNERPRVHAHGHLCCPSPR